MRLVFESSRRAAALLIVLATLVLTTTAATIVIRAAVIRKVNQHVYLCAITADDLFEASEAAILNWLNTQSSEVVLAPEALQPKVEVLHDRWLNKGECIEITITAWDQCGMIPLEAVQKGSPLRMVLTEETLGQIPAPLLENHLQKISEPLVPTGLDQFVGNDESKAAISSSPFPVATLSNDPLLFGDPQERYANQQLLCKSTDDGLRLGAIIATHNPFPGSINVNTAPIPIVETAMRLAGRGGLDQVLAARQAGIRAPIGEPVGRSAASEFAPQLVTASNSWGIRVDINVSPLRRSWWAVYQQTSNQWECVQRLVITH